MISQVKNVKKEPIHDPVGKRMEYLLDPRFPFFQEAQASIAIAPLVSLDRDPMPNNWV